MKSVYGLAVVAVAIAFFAAFAHTNNNALITTNQALNGAFRDGVYLGTLAARRAEAPHIAFGRWATANDQQSFREGYSEAYEQTLALMVHEKPQAQNNSAPYRDGLYLGQLDAMQGRPEHVGSGRWAQSQDREFFTVGYRRAYADTIASRAQKATGTSQALLVR
jgi:hypothetical protein